MLFHVTSAGASIAPHQLTAGDVLAFFFIKLKRSASADFCASVSLRQFIKSGNATAASAARRKNSRRFYSLWFIGFFSFQKF
jgi:hypothetical protein